MIRKMPWIDVEKCDIHERCRECRAARYCRHEALSIVSSDNGSVGGCRVAIDMERCRFCGDCSHACELGAVRMV